MPYFHFNKKHLLKEVDYLRMLLTGTESGIAKGGTMRELGFLLGVDSTSTLRFFFEPLQEMAGEHKKPFSKLEILYVASILAHYAQTSRYDAKYMGLLSNLSELFNHFIMFPAGYRDPEIMELAGAQNLLLAGFFRDQMITRHNVNWYDQVGQVFYERAGLYSREDRKRSLLSQISVNFPVWTLICRDLSRKLRDRPYLVRP